MITAKLYKGRVDLAVDSAYDTPGRVVLTGEPILVSIVADWLAVAFGFEHGVGYPYATPRDVHAALTREMKRYSVSDIQVDDAHPPNPLPKGWVS